MPDRPLEIALESILERHGFLVGGEPDGFDCELLTAPGAGTGAVPAVLLVDPTPVRSQIALGAVEGGLVAAAVAWECIDDVPFVLDGVARSLTMVSSSLGRAARLLPSFSRRQHVLLALLSGEHVKHAGICAALVCSPTTLKREVRHLRERLGLASHHELPAYARSLGYSPYLSAGEIGLLHSTAKPIPEAPEALR
ncbi:MAG TPA: hypothetical protein VH479_05995 [Acidimicrobiales bacterium]